MKSVSSVSPIKLHFMGSDIRNETFNKGMHCFQNIRNGLRQSSDSEIEPSGPIFEVINFGHSVF